MRWQTKKTPSFYEVFRNRILIRFASRSVYVYRSTIESCGHKDYGTCHSTLKGLFLNCVQCGVADPDPVSFCRIRRWNFPRRNWSGCDLCITAEYLMVHLHLWGRSTPTRYSYANEVHLRLLAMLYKYDLRRYKNTILAPTPAMRQ